MAWKCAFDEKGTATVSDITVGQKLNLYCSGDPAQLAHDGLKIDSTEATGKEVFGKLHILEVKSLATDSGQFIVTSYEAGQHKAEGLILTDGLQRVPLEGFEWQVRSVIENPAQQPYPSFGPWSMSISWFYWAILVVVIFMAVWKAVIEFRKQRTRKKLFDDLKSFKTAKSPYDELHTDLRRLERGLAKMEPKSAFESLERSYRLYLIRELQVPALEWDDKDIVKEIKRRHKSIYNLIRVDLIDYFSELRKIKATVRLEDCEFLLKQCQKISDKISDLMEGELKRA